jgi:toxin ParE1/3/4
MPYRLVGRAEDRIDAVLLESARRWGIDSAARYHRLILAAMAAVGDSPALPGSREVPKVAGVRALHLRWARRLVALEQRVGEPVHLVIYRVAPDGVVEIPSLVHDRTLLARAARRAGGRRMADANGAAGLPTPMRHSLQALTSPCKAAPCKCTVPPTLPYTC